jgi:DNA primase
MEEKIRILTDILGRPNTPQGGELYFHCPYCNHHKKKLAINLKRGWHCWVCDKRGKGAYRIVRKFGTYQQRQKWLELEGRLDLSEFDQIFNEINNIEEEQVISLPDEFISLCNKHLPRTSQKALEYLQSRGIGPKEILRWKIGYCPEGRYGGRIIIPSFNNKGNINYFIARSYVGHKWRYLNPPAERDIIFNELYVDWDEPVTLVEGVFDAISAGENAVPVLGSTLRDKAKLFQAIALNDTPVYLAFDADAEKKTGQIIKNMLYYDIELYKIDTTGFEDIGEMPRRIFESRKQMAQAVDNDDFFLMDELRRIM